MKLYLLLLITCSLSTVAYSEIQQVETDWLKANVGFKGTKIGAEILSITDLTNKDERSVKIAIPKLEDQKIEEVLVIGERNTYKLDETTTMEVIHDMDLERTGIVVQLGEDERFKLLINYFDYKKQQ